MTYANVRHDNGAIDKRYTIQLEYCGHAKPLYVARFCDEFIGSSISRAAMVMRCACHKAVMNGSTIIEEQKA